MASTNSRCDGFLEWSVVGSFTSIGYRLRSRHWSPVPDDALDDRVVIITGATSGIGETIATEATRLGARLRFVARNRDKAEELKQRLVELSRHGDIDYYVADLSIMAQVAAVSEQILADQPQIDVLVNNVGVLPPERTETSEGLELAYATDLVGPFLLTNRLLGRLIKSAPARIVNLVSGGMYTQELELDDPNYERGDYHGSVAYARAKRGLMTLTRMWADQLAGTRVTANATHPGWVDTPGVRNSLPGFYRITRPLLRTTGQGADTVVWLATSHEGGDQSGELWHDRTTRRQHRLSRTIETSAERNQLWAQLTETVERVLSQT